MSNSIFADRLCRAVKLKQSHVAVGLDPVLARLPRYIVQDAAARFGETTKGAAAAFLGFNQMVIDAVADQSVMVKPQLAFYEAYGYHGYEAFWETVRYARSRGLMAIADAKRGDIGSTVEAYANAFLGHADTAKAWGDPDLWADSMTVNPYLGTDGLRPFVDRCEQRGSGLFILVKTSNPSSGELQDQELLSGENVAQQVAKMVDQLGLGSIGEHGYSSIGAVIGATYPAELQRSRAEMPRAIFLVPGYGAQGGGGEDVVGAFNPDGLGAVITAARSVIFAYHKGEGTDVSPADARRAIQAALATMNKDINGALARAGKLFW